MVGTMLKQVDEFRPSVVVLDPISSFEGAGSLFDARAMVMRMIDLLKSRQISTLFTALTPGGETAEQTSVGLSSLIDSWILLRNIEQSGERTRGLYTLKSRGMKHSDQVRELVITDHAVKLEEICVGPEGVLVGSARLAQQMRDRATVTASRGEIEHKRTLLARKRNALKARIAELETEFTAEAHDIEQAIAQEKERQDALASGRATQALQRERASPSRDRANGGGREEHA